MNHKKHEFDPEQLLLTFTAEVSRERNHSPRMASRGRQAVTKLANFFGRPMAIKDLFEEEVQVAIGRMASVNFRNYLCMLCRVVGAMQNEDVRQRWDRIKRERAQNKSADAWHSRPRGYISKCPICGCDADFPGVHRRTNATDGVDAPWIAKLAGLKGYEIREIWPVGDERGERTGGSKSRPLPVDLENTDEAKRFKLIGLAVYYREKFEPIMLHSRTFNTKRLYRTTLRKFATFLNRGPVLRDLNNDEVSRYLGWVRDNGASTGSVAKERNNLLAIWRFACRRGDLKVWPEIPVVNVPKRVPIAWTLVQMRKIIAACEDQTGQICGVRADKWWKCLILVLYDTGERLGAVLGLKWVDVFIDAGDPWIICRAESRKGGREDRSYRIAADSAKALRDIRGPERDEVFPWSMSPQYIFRMFGSILKSAGLPHDRRSKFHRIRRTTASYFKAAGGDATEFLGHSRASVTARYLDPSITKPKQAADLLERIVAE